MQGLPTLALGAAALAASMAANAAVLDARFSGTVQAQAGTGYAVGAPVSGEFLYDTGAGSFLSFTIGGAGVAPGYASKAGVSPDQYTALYQAQLSPVTQGGTINSSFTVDLEGLGPWPSFDAVALLTDAGTLATNLDTGASTFGYYTGNADGTGIRQLTASLSGITVSTVPEPATAGLLLAGALALGVRRARSRR